MTTTKDQDGRGDTARRLYDILDEAAARLWDMPDDLASDIPEDVLAREIAAAIPAGERGAALWFFCHERAQQAAPPDFMLNECEESTYAAISQIAAVLHEVITAQGRADYAMTMIAAEEIRRRYEHERSMRELGLTT
jgi:hypothetical protein